MKESTELLKLPFNHIHFTGSPNVGKIVMEAAAKNLSGVTLELGGKSPVIIDGTGNIKEITEKIAWAKTLNCGQTCIAPDYILIQKNELATFISHFKTTVNKFYNSENNGLNKSLEYGRIVDDKNQKSRKTTTRCAKKRSKKNLEVNIKKKKNLWSPLYLLNKSRNADHARRNIWSTATHNYF